MIMIYIYEELTYTYHVKLDITTVVTFLHTLVRHETLSTSHYVLFSITWCVTFAAPLKA